MCSPSPSFMAILPERFTCTKSLSLLRRTSPDEVAKTTSSRSQAASSSGRGSTVVMRSPCSSGRRLMKALPRALAKALGSFQTLSL